MTVDEELKETHRFLKLKAEEADIEHEATRQALSVTDSPNLAEQLIVCQNRKLIISERLRQIEMVCPEFKTTK